MVFLLPPARSPFGPCLVLPRALPALCAAKMGTAFRSSAFRSFAFRSSAFRLVLTGRTVLLALRRTQRFKHLLHTLLLGQNNISQRRVFGPVTRLTPCVSVADARPCHLDVPRLVGRCFVSISAMGLGDGTRSRRLPVDCTFPNPPAISADSLPEEQTAP